MRNGGAGTAVSRFAAKVFRGVLAKIAGLDSPRQLGQNAEPGFNIRQRCVQSCPAVWAGGSLRKDSLALQFQRLLLPCLRCLGDFRLTLVFGVGFSIGVLICQLLLHRFLFQELGHTFMLRVFCASGAGFVASSVLSRRF